MGFFRSGFTVAVLKGAGIRPEEGEGLIRVARSGRMLCEMFWKEEGIGSREQVVVWLAVTSV